MIYANMKWMAFTLKMEELTEYDFWYADYHELPQCPYDYKMWQYSEAVHSGNSCKRRFRFVVSGGKLDHANLFHGRFFASVRSLSDAFSFFLEYS